MKPLLTENTPLISLEGISFSYGKREILNNISLNFEQGKFYALAGESGSGKSTLLYILGGFQKPSSGRYTFQNQSVYSKFGEFGLGRFRKKNIGFLFQDFRLLPFLTVAQNIKFPALFSGAPLNKQRIDDRMQKLGIAHRAGAYPTAISGGEAQRTGLARALLMDPPLLLLDEPTGNLDRATEANIVKVLEDLKAEGLTLICVSHSPHVLERADHVFDLADAKITERKRPKRKKS